MSNKRNREHIQFQNAIKNMVESHSISYMAKAITVEAFRNGPVEDMHAEGKLSDDDMKTLNKYMVNKIARLMYLYETKDYNSLQTLLGFAVSCASEWDEPEIDMAEIAELNNGFSIDEAIQFCKNQNMLGFSNN